MYSRLQTCFLEGFYISLQCEQGDVVSLPRSNVTRQSFQVPRVFEVLGSTPLGVFAVIVLCVLTQSLQLLLQLEVLELLCLLFKHCFGLQCLAVM